VTLRGREGTSSELVTADADGRLHVEVPLGPPNPYQQDTAEALAAGSPVYTTTATIAKARGARPGG